MLASTELNFVERHSSQAFDPSQRSTRECPMALAEPVADEPKFNFILPPKKKTLSTGFISIGKSRFHGVCHLRRQGVF
jgi:hypothetical protein